MTTITALPARAVLEGRALVAMVRAGALGLEPPVRMARIGAALRDYGAFSATVRIAALRHGSRPAIVDDRGEMTYAELDERINRLTNAFRSAGLAAPRGTVGVLCRNGRAPMITALAASRAGLRCVWLNTGFAARQAQEVTEREGVDLLVHDAELAEVVEGLALPLGTYAVSTDGAGTDDLDALIDSGSADLPPAPAQHGTLILLTSGTTGTPKGAPRPEPKGFVLPASLLARMPMRAGGTVVMGPPVFHGTGLLLASVAIALGCTLVLRPRFDPEQMLDDIETRRADTICVVPIMLQRMLALGDAAIAERDLGSLRVVFTAGAPLHSELARRVTDALGEVIYNLYGSTEVSVATIATPADVRVAPTSVGRPALGVSLRILDDRGEEVPRGQTGRVFVAGATPFEGYTTGGHKEIIDGHMATGDLGHLDADGRLHVDGRDDDMVVSGGENVFPGEIEELLSEHTAVADVAVLGAPDEEFGQRLRAFVVLAKDASLTADEVRDLVRQNLARYKVPRDVEFLDELPRTQTGKVLKRELATR